MKDVESPHAYAEAHRRGELYEELSRLLDSSDKLDYEDKLKELTLRHGVSDVKWMLEVLREDLELGKELTRSKNKPPV